MIATCLPVEARVLAEMICNPDALEVCDNVETGDFVDYRHVVLLCGIREAQLHGEVNVDTVVDAIRARAMEFGQEGMASEVGYEFIGELVAKAPKSSSLDSLRADVNRLREARDFREQMWSRRV